MLVFDYVKFNKMFTMETNEKVNIFKNIKARYSVSVQVQMIILTKFVRYRKCCVIHDLNQQFRIHLFFQYRRMDKNKMWIIRRTCGRTINSK